MVVDLAMGPPEPVAAVARRMEGRSQSQVSLLDFIQPLVKMPVKVPRPYRDGYSESDGLTSDDSSCRPLVALQLPASPPPGYEARGGQSENSQPQSLAWDGYTSGPSFPDQGSFYQPS